MTKRALINVRGRVFGIAASARGLRDTNICPGATIGLAYGSKSRIFKIFVPSFGPALPATRCDRALARLAKITNALLNKDQV